MQESHVGEPPPDPAYGWLVVGTLAVTTKWFRARRREALTTITLVGAFSSFIFSPLTGTLTAELGWRGALMVLAVILAAVGIPLHAAVLRPAPPAAKEDAVTPARDQVHAAFTSRRFWFLAIALALGSYTWSAMLVHLVPFLIDAGDGFKFVGLAAGV